MPKKVVVEVEKLVKQYKDVLAVDEISFDIHQGEIFSLVGPNGAGKTTTVEILECLRKPTDGSAKVLGLDVVEDGAKIKKRIGVMPQDFNTFERLTVKENVELVAQIYGMRGKAKEALGTLGLWQIKDRKFHTLSGGMKRRVGFCMALVSDPELLFLDEPTTGLDPQARKDSWDVMRSLKDMGKTVFLTSHYMEEVERLSDRAAVIANVLQQALLAFALTAVMIAVGWIIFDVRVLPGFFAILLIFLGAVAFCSVGIVLGNVIKDIEATSGVGNAIGFPMMFLSGAFWPLEMMPGYLQTIAKFLPLYYFHDGLRSIMVYQSPTLPTVSFLVLGIFSAVFILLAIKVTKWKEL